jgi:hypothetical protein
MRREKLADHTFTKGYSDGRNPFRIDPSQWGPGSHNLLMLGEDLIRPINGFFTQGTGTGSGLMFPLGSTWGGLRKYSTVSPTGSLLETYSKTLFTIGSGEVTKQGIPVAEAATDFTFISADVTVGTGTVSEVAHGLTTGEPLYLTNSANDLPAGWSQNTAYFAIAVTADTFRVASTYKNALAGTQVIPSDAGTGTTTVHSDNGGNPIRASSILQVAYNQVATYFYEYVESAGLSRVDAPVVSMPTQPTSPYLGIINGAVNFKIAAMRDASMVGVDIDTPDAPVKGLASSATAVLVPINNTVRITFPTAVTGQTHWAVFSTYEGFGGTGNFYRLGYRTSSDADAIWYFGISETTVAAATDRTLEFDFRSGDLLPETAWIQDYEPPPGSHCVQLENIMIVLGAYDGTVAAVSLPNDFESYNPFHLLYFAEPVTAVLSRQIDNYAFVACRNSIHTIQYVGYRGDELPSATLTTITPEVGIAYQHNWAMGAGQIAMWLDGAGIALMTNEGIIDFEWGKEVAYLTQNWTAVNVKVAFNPTTRSFVFGHLNESVSYCLESGVWSTPVFNSDLGITGNWLAAINAQGVLYVSLDNAGTETAYIYDDGTSTMRVPTCSIGQWISGGTGRGVAIYEMAAAIKGSANVEPVILGLHKNLFPTYLRNGSVTSASAVLTVTGAFTSNYTGVWAAVFGTDIGGAGVNYLIVKLTYVNANTCNMSDPVTGSAVNAQASASSLFVLTGCYFRAITPQANIQQHLRNIRPAVQDMRSFCASVWQPTDAQEGAVYQVEMFGNPRQTSAVGVSGG